MKKLMIGLSLIIASMGIAFAAVKPLMADNVVVKTPEVQLIKKTDKIAEVFMELDNTSNQAVALVAANSMTAAQTQLHKSINRDGQETMKKTDKITINPYSNTDLKLGGIHIMLMGLKQNLNKGDSVPVVLIFNDGSSITIHATVQ